MGMLSDLRWVIGAVLAAAMLALACLGLIAVVHLTHQGKTGPRELSRSLPFDDRSDWNQFYDPESARRFAGMARRADASDEAGDAADASAEAAPTVPAAGAVDAGVADPPPAIATAPGSDFPGPVGVGEIFASRDAATVAPAPSTSPGIMEVSPPASETATPAMAAPAMSVSPDAPDLPVEGPPAAQGPTDALRTDAASDSDAGVPATPEVVRAPMRDATPDTVVESGPPVAADRVVNLPTVVPDTHRERGKSTPATASKRSARPAALPVRRAAAAKPAARKPVRAPTAARVGGAAPTPQPATPPLPAQPQYTQQQYVPQPSTPQPAQSWQPPNDRQPFGQPSEPRRGW